MSKTYEEIKQRVLNNTDINVDKREGSFLNILYRATRFSKHGFCKKWIF